MTEYRTISAQDLTTEYAAVEVYQLGTDTWTPMYAKIAHLSGGSVIVTTFDPEGWSGGATYPLHHGIKARVAVEDESTEAVQAADTPAAIVTHNADVKRHSAPSGNRDSATSHARPPASYVGIADAVDPEDRGAYLRPEENNR